MLGPWCFTAKEILDGKVPADAAHYHWDDRAKLARDYDYVQSLHARVLDALAVTLNRYHRTSHSRRYWQIVADPWLMAYVSVLFDRFESLHAAFAGTEEFEFFSGEATDRRPPDDYNAFIGEVLTDDWNEWLFARIAESRYPGRCAVRVAGLQQAPAARAPASAGAGKRIARMIDGWLARFSCDNPVAFVQSYFRPGALLRLCLRLRQVPRAYLHEFPLHELLPGAASARAGQCARDLRADFAAATDFERFICDRLPLDLPASLVEDFPALAARARELPQRPRIIVTATAQFTNTVAKAWFAERVAAGAALVVLEHGGSFPAKRELLDFEEDIADVRIPWFKPYHSKHLQLPPSKLVGAPQPRIDAHGPCLIVANESPPWVFRAHFYPMAHQCLRSFRMICDLVDSLSEEVAQRVSIRPAPDQGWNLSKLFVGRFGARRVSRVGTLESALAQARLIVCSYPETTFSEAMASDIPVVLVYPPEIYERHPVTAPLLEQMRSARIVFTDATEAAAHVSAVWSNLDAWWNSAEVATARRAFRDTALRFDGDWIREWTHFLRSLPSKENTEIVSR